MFKQGKMSTIRYNANRSRKPSKEELRKMKAGRDRLKKRLEEEARPPKIRRKVDGKWITL